MTEIVYSDGIAVTVKESYTNIRNKISQPYGIWIEFITNKGKSIQIRTSSIISIEEL